MLGNFNNWTRLVIALILLCSIFSFNAAAQDKPLTKESLEELVEKLKGSLAEVIDDEVPQTSITKKWDARMEGLVGKTRQEVVAALLGDVKSVVEDDEEKIKTLTESFAAIINDSGPDPVRADSPAPARTPHPDVIFTEPPRKPIIWIKIVQAGWYSANFEITWDEPGKPNQSWKEKGKTNGWLETINLAGEATNIRLRMENDTGLVWQPQREIFNKTLQPSDLNKCYRVTGITLGSSYDNNCQ